MSLPDHTLYCRDCNQTFIFTQGEHEFYVSRGLSSPPSRCPSCRAIRKQQQQQMAGRSPMGGGYGNTYRDPQMNYQHPNAQYRDPHAQYRDPHASYRDPNAQYRDPNANYQYSNAQYRDPHVPRQIYNTICSACGKPAQVPFQPSADRAVYCNECFYSQPRGNRSYDRQPRW